MTSTGGYAEVIGDPVTFSKSPIIHRFWLDRTDLQFDYRATRVARADFPSYLQDRRSDANWRGCNVTMPLKLDAAMLADDASDRAVAAGAANILVARDGKTLAGNTDVGGVLQVLGPILAKDAPCDITLLGNGGAARAVLVALHLLNIEAVTIQARDLSVAYRLAVQFGLSAPPRPFDSPIETAGLINATPLGMPGVDPLVLDIRSIPAKGWVFDMVTEPAETQLLGAAKARGLTTIDGLEMLIEQAAESFMLMFGREAPRHDDAVLMARLRA